MDSQGEGLDQNQQSHQKSHPQMSNSSMDSLDETLDHNHENPNDNEGEHEWETIARAWLSTLPKDQPLNPTDIEAWLQSNSSLLPDHIKSMAPSQVLEMFTKFQNNTAALSSEEKDLYHNRFQRTDQWMPIYSWLESLKTDEVIRSDEILDWLTANPEVRDDLYARHSRYHLMHYIKKCHMKILKRKEKKEGTQTPTKTIPPPRVHKNEEKKSLVVFPGTSVTKLPKDSPIYMVKRNEAFRKYEILIEMEKQLAAVFPKHDTAN